MRVTISCQYCIAFEVMLLFLVVSVISVFLLLCICFFYSSVYVYVLFLSALLPDSNK